MKDFYDDDLSLDLNIQKAVDKDPDFDIDKYLCKLFIKDHITKSQLMERLSD